MISMWRIIRAYKILRCLVGFFAKMREKNNCATHEKQTAAQLKTSGKPVDLALLNSALREASDISQRDTILCSCFDCVTLREEEDRYCLLESRKSVQPRAEIGDDGRVVPKEATK